MPRKPAAKQVWECPTCAYTYRSPIRITAALCPNKHVGKTRDMKLIEDLTRE